MATATHQCSMRPTGEMIVLFSDGDWMISDPVNGEVFARHLRYCPWCGKPLPVDCEVCHGPCQGH
jgi:hypothetical protein